MSGARHYRLDGYRDLPVRLARGEGHWLWDTTGKRYIDFCAGFGAVSCGHAHPVVTARIERQLRTLTAHAYFETDIADECIAALDNRLPQGLHTAAIYNTGAEAVEQALRLARLITGKQRIIAFEGHFHGKSHGAMFLYKNYPAAYGPRPEGYSSPLAFGAPEHGVFSPAALEEAIDAAACAGDVAAVICEAAVGYSGPYALPSGFIPTLRRCCDRHGILLIVDEVFASFMRCGEWFLSLREGCRPDVLCFGKGLGNGMPVSAVACGPAAAARLKETAPGSTFAGNLLACAAALGVVDALSAVNGLGDRVRGLERRFFDAVTTAFPDGARGVQPGGVGLLLGLRLESRSPVEVMEVFRAVLDAGVLVSNNPRGLRVSPPLTISDEAFDHGMDKLLRVLAARL